MQHITLTNSSLLSSSKNHAIFFQPGGYQSWLGDHSRHQHRYHDSYWLNLDDCFTLDNLLDIYTTNQKSFLFTCSLSNKYDPTQIACANDACYSLTGIMTGSTSLQVPSHTRSWSDGWFAMSRVWM
jgi:hypothetical protein